MTHTRCQDRAKTFRERLGWVQKAPKEEDSQARTFPGAASGGKDKTDERGLMHRTLVCRKIYTQKDETIKSRGVGEADGRARVGPQKSHREISNARRGGIKISWGKGKRVSGVDI